MPTPPLTDDELQRRIEAYLEHGSSNKAAQALGINRRSMDKSLRIAAERGLMGSDPVLPGFRMALSKVVFGKDGNVIRRTVEQREARGDRFEMPAGQRIRAVSALLDPDGREIVKWVKTRSDEPDIEALYERAQNLFADLAPFAQPVDPPASDDDLLVVYPLADWHVGMYAWGKETADGDWDLALAETAIRAAMFDVIDRAPPAGSALILGLGDLLHADSAKNLTPDSGNIMDVDTRYAKCFDVLLRLTTAVVDRARAKHDRLRVVFKEGNHDRSTTVAMRYAARAWFRNEPRVEVDVSPSPFAFHHFGVNLIGGTHGDRTKIDTLPLVMAQTQREAWGASKVFHWHTGHLHHDRTREIQGVRVHVHRAPIPKDHYHAAHGYLSGRSVSHYVYHRTDGYLGHSERELL